MNQKQDPTTEQVIAILAEYTDAHAELQRLQQIHSRIIEGQYKDKNPRLEAAQKRFDSALAKVPSREQAEVACLAELQQMGVTWEQARAEFKAAVTAEMDAWIARDTAQIRLRYASAEPILDISPAHATRVLHHVQESYNQREYQKRVAEDRMDRTYKRLQEFGADPRHPEHFPAFAVGRVDRLLGHLYDAAHLAGVKKQFGLTDKLLNRLAAI